MTQPLLLLMRFIRDLLEYPEELIKRGRLNEKQDDYKTGYIVVDALSAAQPLSRGERYDGNEEKLTHSSRVRLPVTIDFYGDDAFANARRLHLLLASEAALNLQKKHGITVGGISQITDVKTLTGQQYGNRYQAELVVHYSPSVILDVLRIDEAVIETKIN